MEPNHQRLNAAFQAGDADSLICLIKRSQDSKEEAQQKLREAAQAGDFDALYDSLHHFPDILDRIDETPFVDTPLHVAAKAGHTHLALEVIRLKPSFGRKLNPAGLSPLHLALDNGHPETAQRLVKFDKELIRVKGRDGSTPLHLAAERDETDVLAEFLRACPASIEDLTVRDKSVLHIAVEHCRIRAYKVMLGWIKRTNKIQVLNWRDDEANTALHAAVSTSQTKECIVELLSKSGANMNEKNLEGYTALDLALTLCPDHCRTKTETILCKAGALKSSSLITDDSSLAEFLMSRQGYWEAKVGQVLRARRKLSMEMSQVLLVVAVLIATATFQTVLQPLGGVPDDKNDRGGASVTVFSGNILVITLLPVFYFLNTTAFVASVTVILIVLESCPFRILLLICLVFLIMSYWIALLITSQNFLSALSIKLASVVFGCVFYYFEHKLCRRVEGMRGQSVGYFTKPFWMSHIQMQRLRLLSSFLKSDV